MTSPEPPIPPPDPATPDNSAPQGHAVAAMDDYGSAFPSALPRPPLRAEPTHRGRPRRRR